jgi:transcriptional regulator
VDENNLKIVYDIDEVINILIRDGMDVDEAIEYYEYNIAGAYVGENTPSFIRLIREL